MRAFLATLAASGALIAAVAVPADARGAPASRALTKALKRGIGVARRSSGAQVVDMTTGQTLFSSLPGTGRLPASVEKLYTTSTALLRFGPNARLATSVLGVGSFDSSGGFHGTLYLRGGGDPTFGSQSFDRYAYGPGNGATMQQLVANLIRATAITSVQGAIVGDESYFDSLRGTPPYGYRAASEVEGELSALAYDRGLANAQGTAYQAHPALFATQAFASALRAAGVQVPKQDRINTGTTPLGAPVLASVHSPRMLTLIRMTNTPSDNYFAEMLLKGIGAAYGGAGTTAAGAAVVRAQMATSFHIYPRLVDGSGLSRQDVTTPRQVVNLLEAMSNNGNFTSSLSIAGETGTMEIGLRATAAQGQCRGKTGTLSNVANLVGYCTARDGQTLAFAFLMNSIDPVTGHLAEDRMAVALAKYGG